MQMEIGEVSFSINVSANVPYILQKHDPTYQSFFKKVNQGKNKTSETIDIKINLELGNLPDTGKLTKIFDSGQSWLMFRGGAEDDMYWLALHPPAFKKPVWVAQFNRDIAEVTVYCSKKITRKKQGKIMISNPVRHPLDQVLFMYILASKNGALIHAAGIEINGKGFIFPGPSGAGKSTLSRLLNDQRRQNNPNLFVLSDERIVVRKINGTLKAFGTPWSGQAGIALNKSTPLCGIYFLHHGTDNRVKELKPREALEKLLKVTSIPWYDREVMPQILRFCEELISSVPFFELHFTPDHRAVKFLEKICASGG
ncbi:MAG: hypothetical protein JSV88_20340, partial [Candidatus Aminicenantes bacterium]